MARIVRTLGIVTISMSVCTAVTAQSNVDPVNKHAWGNNIGWQNWRDTTATTQGVVVGITFLSGFVWGENIGWLTVGDGSPANGAAYSNTSGADSGVNILPSGFLDGFAWGENIGWVNFGTEPFVSPAFGARFMQDRLAGFAWSENAGWINLDNVVTGKFVGLNCPADFNNDGIVDGADISIILNVFGSSTARLDLNDDGIINSGDISFVLNLFGQCP